jgi:DNA-binding NarL/FixJ family response regulator
MTSEGPIRLLLVDDNDKVRSGLISFFKSIPDMEVVGAVATGEDAVVAAVDVSPDVVLMDLSMPGIGGIEATRLLSAAHPGLRVVMLTSFGGRDRFKEALRNGAVGYVLKDAAPPELLKTLRYVARLGIQVGSARST